MKKISKLIACVMITAIILCCPTLMTSAHAVTQDGIIAEIVTDKDSYTKGEDIAVNVTVRNTNNYSVNNVSMEVFLPDGLKLKENTALKTGAINLEAGQGVTLPYVVVLNDTNQSNKIDSTTNSTTATIQNNVGNISDNPKTDVPDFKAAIILIVISTLILVLTFKKKKTAKGFLIIMLCVILATSSLSGSGLVKALPDTDGNQVITVSKIITVNGNQAELKAQIKYSNRTAEGTTQPTQGIVEPTIAVPQPTQGTIQPTTAVQQTTQNTTYVPVSTTQPTIKPTATTQTTTKPIITAKPTTKPTTRPTTKPIATTKPVITTSPIITTKPITTAPIVTKPVAVFDAIFNYERLYVVEDYLGRAMNVRITSFQKELRSVSSSRWWYEVTVKGEIANPFDMSYKFVFKPDYDPNGKFYYSEASNTINNNKFDITYNVHVPYFPYQPITVDFLVTTP